MWTRPKCGRTFVRKNQSHYCGGKPSTIHECISRKPEDARQELERMRDILRSALPDAEEGISWSMPTYWKGHNLIHFAAPKHLLAFILGTPTSLRALPLGALRRTDGAAVRSQRDWMHDGRRLARLSC